MQRLIPLTLLLAACAAADRGSARSERADSEDHASDRPHPAVAFRIPADGGNLAVFSLPDLRETAWGSGAMVSGARGAVGVDLQGSRLFYRDQAGAVASFDLVALRERSVSPRGTMAVLGSDGTLLSVDSAGTVRESEPWGMRTWSASVGRGVTAAFAAPGSRLIVIRRSRGDSLLIASREGGIAVSAAVPEAADRAASVDGDAIAFATDSGLVVLESRDPNNPWFVRLAGRPRRVAFSPSGHRVYVALGERPSIVVVDRFSRRERSSVALPGPAGELRIDPWGRGLLARPAADGESDIWVIDAIDGRVAGAIRGAWASDLPAVSQDGVLLTREGSAVVARRFRTLDSLGAVRGGARDVWFPGRWVPTSATAATRQQVAESGPAERSTERGSAQREPAAPGTWWVQVASVRLESGARTLAAELTALRHPAHVVPPRADDDPWRVMTGPFRSREVADSAGRALGRPYFVLNRPPEDGPE